MRLEIDGQRQRRDFVNNADAPHRAAAHKENSRNESD